MNDKEKVLLFSILVNEINVFVRIVKDRIDNLVFISFKTVLSLRRKERFNNDILSYTIDGSVSSKKRMEIVNKFNEDKTNVLFNRY